MPFHIEVEMFPGNQYCDDAILGAVGIRGSLTKQLLNGVKSEEIGSTKYFTHTTSASITLHKQFLQVTHESICEGRVATGLDAHPFAGGEGTKENPYLICSVPQFHAMNNSSYLSNHFRLAADLDFNPYSKGLAAVGILPAHFACLEDGSNFIPVGYPNATCTPGNPLVFNTVIPFTGSFMGGGHKISNLRLRAEGQNYIGMFAQIQSGTVANDFGDLKIQNAEISGAQKVGTIAGDVSGTASGDINFWKIYAKNLDIDSRDMTSSSVGSLLGFLSNGTMERIMVAQSSVRGDSNYVGGIVGMIVNSTANEVSAEVDIYADSGTPISGIGGVAGDVTGSSLNYVKHEGGIYTNGWIIGGIAGNVNPGSSIENFYTMSFIYSAYDNSNLLIGGAVGKWDSTGTFGPGYSLSTIKTKCLTSCQQGALVGSATSTASATLYKLNSMETGYSTGALMDNETFPTSGITISDMRNLTSVPALTDANGSDWIKVNGEYPRFDFEKHPCSLGVSGTGTGTILSPFNVCHEGQYLALGSAPSNTYHQLLGNIRLSNNTSTITDIPNFAANLNGQNYAVLGGNGLVSGGTNTGHIGTIASTGVLRNIKYLGLSRFSNAGTVITDAHGVLAATNSGEIDNVILWAFGSYPKYGSLVVGKNTASGKMRALEVSGSLVANFDGFATLAIENLGLIEDTKTQNEIICNEGAGCDTVAGLVLQNSGTIRRTEMSTHAREKDASCMFTSDISMLVDLNTGLIQDVLVPDYTDFRTTNGGYYFHRNNSGQLERVFNAGRIEHDPSYLSLTAGFPTQVSASSADTGTHTDVLRTGAKSGKVLLFEKNFTCSAADVLTINDWSSIVDISSWNTAFIAGGYVTDGQKLFAELKYSNDTKKMLRVLSYSVGNNFGVIAGGCSAGTSGKVTLYYTNDLAIDVAGNVASTKIMLPQNSLYTNFSAGWQNLMWDYNNLTHRQEMLNYYGYIMGVFATPVTPRVWELEEDGSLSLFNEK